MHTISSLRITFNYVRNHMMPGFAGSRAPICRRHMRYPKILASLYNFIAKTVHAHNHMKYGQNRLRITILARIIPLRNQAFSALVRKFLVCLLHSIYTVAISIMKFFCIQIAHIRGSPVPGVRSLLLP